METLLIKVSEREKANMLMELLKSVDFIESVDMMGDLKRANKLFERANEAAASTELKDMTMDEINHEIKQYRLEKRSVSN
jgi:ATP:corrinoid adenosyltransferase